MRAHREIRNSRESWSVITPEELAKHTSISNKDAWICIKGIVYDVTMYATEHPGGADKIEKYAGKDATDVFNLVHPYVDVDAILHDYQIGVLKGSPSIPKGTFCAKISAQYCSCMRAHPHAPITSFQQDSIVGTYILEFQGASEDVDWTIGINDRQILQVFKRVDKRHAWYSSYELPEPLYNDMLNLEFRNNFQHVYITLRKPLPTTVWAKQSHGLRELGDFYSMTDELTTFNAHIYSKKCLSHNVLLFAIKVCHSARINIPVGYHVRLHVGDVSRPYTPVCTNLIEADVVNQHKKQEHYHHHEVTTLYFIIKIYPGGALTMALDNVALDEGMETPTIKVSTPYGHFDTDFLNDFGILLLLGAGTGITPMIRIIHRFLADKGKLRNKQVIALIVFSAKDHDLIWKNQFVELNDTVQWFHYFPVLTKPGPSWTGLTGRINAELIRTCLTKLKERKGALKKACICGPPGFNATATKELAGTVLAENMFVFAN